MATNQQSDEIEIWKFLARHSVTHIPVAFHTNNLGDDIQSEAASRLWGCRNYLNRDEPETWPKNALVPLTCWFGYGDFPSPAQCLVVGVHIQLGSRKMMSSPQTRNWLKGQVREQGFPALCRDLDTRDFVRSLGIDAEFLGCVTSTLSPYHGPRKGVLIIDKVPTGVEIYGNKATHNVESLKRMNPDERLRTAAQQIDRIAKAAAIHTNRLHALLPARAVHTPVTFYREMVTFQPGRLLGHLPGDGVATSRSVIVERPKVSLL